MTTLSPNAMLPCGTDTRRRDHLAHGELCPVCDPTVEWVTRCPSCRLNVQATGLVVLPHVKSSPWLVEGSKPCAGSEAQVLPPTARQRTPWWTARVA